MAHLFPRFDWHAFSQLLPGGKVQRRSKNFIYRSQNRNSWSLIIHFVRQIFIQKCIFNFLCGIMYKWKTSHLKWFSISCEITVSPVSCQALLKCGLTDFVFWVHGSCLHGEIVSWSLFDIKLFVFNDIRSNMTLLDSCSFIFYKGHFFAGIVL